MLILISKGEIFVLFTNVYVNSSTIQLKNMNLYDTEYLKLY